MQLHLYFSSPLYNQLTNDDWVWATTPSCQPIRTQKHHKLRQLSQCRARFQSVDILWLGLSWLCCGDVTNTKSVSPPTTSLHRLLWIVIILWKLSQSAFSFCLKICEIEICCGYVIKYSVSFDIYHDVSSFRTYSAGRSAWAVTSTGSSRPRGTKRVSRPSTSSTRPLPSSSSLQTGSSMFRT